MSVEIIARNVGGQTLLVFETARPPSAILYVNKWNVRHFRYLRQCSRQSDNSVHMLAEFSDQPSVVEALELNGKELKGRAAQIIHSLQAIVKPQAKSNEAAQREIEEAMSRVKEAQNLISATIDPVIGMLSKEKRSSRRSRSRSRGRRRR